MNKKISDKDKKDWENFLSSDESLPDKDFKITQKKIDKNITLDLHGFSLEEANEKIKHLIFSAYNQGIKKLIIITGKGLHSQNEKNPYISKDLGILRYSVPEYIKNNNELMSLVKEIKEAKVTEGGAGAFYVLLKKKSIK